MKRIFQGCIGIAIILAMVTNNVRADAFPYSCGFSDEVVFWYLTQGGEVSDCDALMNNFAIALQELKAQKAVQLQTAVDLPDGAEDLAVGHCGQVLDQFARTVPGFSSPATCGETFDMYMSKGLGDYVNNVITSRTIQMACLDIKERALLRYYKDFFSTASVSFFFQADPCNAS